MYVFVGGCVGTSNMNFSNLFIHIMDFFCKCQTNKYIIKISEQNNFLTVLKANLSIYIFYVLAFVFDYWWITRKKTSQNWFQLVITWKVHEVLEIVYQLYLLSNFSTTIHNITYLANRQHTLVCESRTS